ncbi:NAD-dependent epimerase/dehydratase family protein [Sulfuricurvum sp.]|uniref:NAD-dependent epimerase/dehydratase family protein n=1 Tax=Sulfuricurvum sp. TaxID=2025608 RepID=UPI003BB76B0A
MQVLITGATGFIGQNLVKSLLNKGYSITTIVRHNSDISSIDSRAEVFRYSGEITELIALFQNKQFDGVIHLASLFLASHRTEDISSLVFSNIQFGTELLEVCKLSETKWFINTGTFWQHYHTDNYNPVNLYAATKQAFEDIAKYYTETSNMVFTTIKLNDTFGPHDPRNKVFNLWYRLSQTDDTLEMSPGEQIIDICYIDDVIGAYETMIDNLMNTSERVKNKTFSVRSKERMSLINLSKIFEKAIGKPLNIQWGKRDYREREVMTPWENGENVPGWEAKYTLDEAIKKTIGAMK